MSIVSLNQLRPGEAGKMQSMQIYGGFRRRLRDMGFLPGSRIECACLAPSGSPIAFWVKDTLLALRIEDCKNIQVALCE